MKTLSNISDRLFTPLLRFYRLRYWFVRTRHFLLKKHLRFDSLKSDKIGEQTISHNLSAFNFPRAVFGCGGRMGLLIYPIIAYFTKDRDRKKILVVGCRTEDDIYWLRAYRFKDTYGLDLFSYSDNIIVGDIHRTEFADKTYDVVLLGWMISYSKDPVGVVKECQRILKPGGLLGIGIQHNPLQDREGLGAVRVNNLNSTDDLKKLISSVSENRIVFEYDHYNKNDLSTVVISQLLT